MKVKENTHDDRVVMLVLLDQALTARTLCDGNTWKPRLDLAATKLSVDAAIVDHQQLGIARRNSKGLVLRLERCHLSFLFILCAERWLAGLAVSFILAPHLDRNSERKATAIILGAVDDHLTPKSGNDHLADVDSKTGTLVLLLPALRKLCKGCTQLLQITRADTNALAYDADDQPKRIAFAIFFRGIGLLRPEGGELLQARLAGGIAAHVCSPDTQHICEGTAFENFDRNVVLRELDGVGNEVVNNLPYSAEI